MCIRDRVRLLAVGARLALRLPGVAVAGLGRLLRLSVGTRLTRLLRVTVAGLAGRSTLSVGTRLLGLLAVGARLVVAHLYPSLEIVLLCCSGPAAG
ncbi:hypothetical protein JBE27_00580, partial [Streptomyces albiflaviniger]|nr:hypothetical protein [Streptomyces albiflaviniger]